MTAYVVDPIFDYRGKPSKYIHIITDITESKLISEKLKRSEQMLANAQRLAKTGGWEWNVEQQKMYWTKELYRLHGFEASQFGPGSRDHINLGLECYNAEDQPKILDAFHRCEKEGVGYELEFEFRKSSGKKIWIKTIAEPVWKGDKVEKVIGNVIDITESKLAKAELFEQSERIKTFFNSINDAIFVHPLKQEGFEPFVEVNDIACKRYGYTYDELMNLSAPDITVKYDVNEHTKPNYRKKMLEKGQLVFETSHIKKSGEIFPVEINANIFHQNAKPYILAVVREITDRKNMEELRTQNWHLKKEESLNRMAGAIAHHFNNHLMAIMGNLELSLKLIELGKSPLKNIVQSMQLAKKASKINELMLTYLGKNTSGKMQMDMSKVCRMIMPLLRSSFSVNIILETDFPAQGPMIYGDVNQVQQLATNLVTNAAESYQEKGTIYLSLKTVLADEIPKKHRFPVDWIPDQNEYACLEVTDSGCGIEEQHIEKLFDPFFSTKATGRGLDLPVVLGIAQANNGVITVKSKCGEGSTFRFYTPVKTKLNSY
nr:PAS domain S-box protein [uncultured Desulfobacter sp.]